MEELKAGCFLIAEPLLGDPNFDRSVILVTEYGTQGTVGYVLNRPLDVKINGLLEGFPEFDAMIYNGGPVEQSNLYFIHNRPDLFEGTVKVTNEIYWGGDFERLQEVIQLGLITPDEIRFFLGYSGWGEGQLESEMADKSWRVIPTGTVDLYTTDVEDMWKEVIINLGGDYQLWANSPSDPLLN